MSSAEPVAATNTTAQVHVAFKSVHEEDDMALELLMSEGVHVILRGADAKEREQQGRWRGGMQG
jgi:hypothetical protein